MSFCWLISLFMTRHFLDDLGPQPLGRLVTAEIQSAADCDTKVLSSIAYTEALFKTRFS